MASKQIQQIVHFLLFLFVVSSALREEDITTPPGRNIKSSKVMSSESSANDFDYQLRPYGFHIRPPRLLAVIRGDGANEGAGIAGEILFIQPHPPNGPVIIQGNVTGLSQGSHGFHIHDFGDPREGCMKTGLHFNPHLVPHGAPTDPIRHVGDLGNIMADADGMAKVDMLDPYISFEGIRGIIGRSIVIHADQDDLGRGNNMESSKSGNSGAKIACGVIGRI